MSITTIMKLIIAGGREYWFNDDDIKRLDALHAATRVTEVCSGAGRGADQCGERWAKSRGIVVKRFPADWDTYGLTAGPRRNRAMSQYADAVVLFPGGKGTWSMRVEAMKARIAIYDWTAG